MAGVLIKNGRIVTAVDDYTADILIDGGKVQTIGKSIAAGPGVEVHDAAGLLLMPGVPPQLSVAVANGPL